MNETLELPMQIERTEKAPFAAPSGSASLPPVLDACCGGRAFWFDKQDSRALFVDKRQGVFPIVRESPRSPVVVNPDWCGSFTAMPFPSDTFDHIIFDPPHIVESSASGNVAKTYGVLRGEWREELRGGFAECFRVLRPGGTLIFKWNELHIPVNEILALTPHKPLYGHRSGKASKTHWIAFLKPNVRTERQPPGEAVALQQNSQETNKSETDTRGGCSLQCPGSASMTHETD